MQAIHAENVHWKSLSRGVREAKIFSTTHGSEETRIDLVEVPAGGFIPPHRHSSRTEFITILNSAGAQLQIGDRIFRPTAGQVFHREPEDILALTNDSHHPFLYSVVSFGFESSDVEWLNEADNPEIENPPLRAAIESKLEVPDSEKTEPEQAAEPEEVVEPEQAAEPEGVAEPEQTAEPEASDEEPHESETSKEPKKTKKRKKKKS